MKDNEYKIFVSVVLTIMLLMMSVVFGVTIGVLILNFSSVTDTKDVQPKYTFTNLTENETELIQYNIINIIDKDFLYGVDEIEFINTEALKLNGDGNDYSGLYQNHGGYVKISVSTYYYKSLESDADIKLWLLDIRDTTCHELWHHWIEPNSKLITNVSDKEHAVMYHIDLVNSCYTRQSLL